MYRHRAKTGGFFLFGVCHIVKGLGEKHSEAAASEGFSLLSGFVVNCLRLFFRKGRKETMNQHDLSEIMENGQPVFANR